MKFNLRKAIYTGREFRLTNEEKSEYRLLSNSSYCSPGSENIVDTSGLFAIPSEKRSSLFGSSVSCVVDGLHEGVRDNLLLYKLGAEFIYPTTNVSVPDFSGVNAEWKPTGQAASGNSGIFDGRYLTPKRLTAKLTYSREFFLSTDDYVDRVLINDIRNAMIEKLQQTILGAHDADTPNMPNGLLSSVPLTIEVPTKANTMSMKTKVLKNNGASNTICYITNSEGYALLEQTPVIAGGDVFLVKNKELNNIPILETNSLIAQGEKNNQYPLICADFSKLVIAQFGMYVTANPFSKGHIDCIDIIINGYFDWCFRSQDWIDRKCIKAAE